MEKNRSSQWNAAELAAIDDADDLRISPLRPDGVTYGTPTWIWAVVVDGELFVRGYNGTASRWYGAAMARPSGRIHAAGSVHDVLFEPAPAGLADAIDAAYRTKYAGSPYLPPMVSDRSRAAGVRIRPAAH
ncbi:MAG TPA: DUF2255 family protein [Propionicimonas sp.]|nr:DUF2255 family protein [Propionicimonas sp.]HRA05323.1 DUF2255 family protein [Propionicimonas sp.]